MTSADPGPLSRSCKRVLTAWSPPTPGQEQLRQTYLDHLSRHPDGWSRECAGAHLTASSIICAAEQRRVLLTLHARIGRWLQTGGHLEPTDPTLEQAACREASEESGIRGLRLDAQPLWLSRHEVDCGVVRPTYHLDVQFLLVAAADAAPSFGEESLDVRWFDLDGLPVVDSSVLDLIGAAGRRLGW